LSYLVFARKYRPQNFKEVINQKHITLTLTNAIKLNRLSHAYLFTGPRGTGKTSIARILAKAINCERGPTPEPCLKCENCLEISEGRSLDVIEIDGASNRGIDEIRTLREKIKFSPVKSRFKVYIIDEVHMLTQEAFNALLKTLEEPPVHITFIFATTEPQKVPLTISSRCQRFDFRRLSAAEIIKSLEKIVQAEGIKITPSALDFIAQNAAGSIRDAQGVLDQLLSYCGQEEIDLKATREVLGKIEEEFLEELVKAISLPDAKQIITLIEEALAQGKDVIQLTRDLREFFRDLMVIKIGLSPKEFSPPKGSLSHCFTLSEIVEMLSLLSQLEQNLKRTSDLRISLELAMIKLAQIKGEIAEGKKEKEILPKEKEKNSLSSTLEEKKEVEEEENGLRKVKKNWGKIIEEVKKTRITVGTFLSEAEPVRVKKRVITVGFPEKFDFHRQKIENKHRKLVEEKITEVLGEKYQIKCELLDQVKEEKKEAGEDPLLAKESEEILRKEKIIQKALELFEGRVVRAALHSKGDLYERGE
jgi:DNA polymerase-3 subunit gamma/tau